MLVLGIETSCDETAAAIIDGEGNVLSNEIYSQFTEHKAFGGVVPEINHEGLKRVPIPLIPYKQM